MIKPLEQISYPIGKFKYEGPYDEATRARYLESIRSLPQRLRALTENLNEKQVDLPYRPGGWTIRQLVHHIADSHMNSLIRFKLALTEENPTIKPYDQDGWANLRDTAETPISVSLQLIEALHTRWTNLLEGFTPDDWQRAAFHPEMKRLISLNEFLALYAWHCEHHLEHIRRAV